MDYAWFEKKETRIYSTFACYSTHLRKWRLQKA